MPNINDIILKRKGSKDFFNTYQSASVIGNNIFKSFVKLFDPEKGFPISLHDKRYGTISNAMALSTLLEIDDMDVDITPFRKEFKFILKKVFDSIYINGLRNLPVFDASPYISSDEIDSYIETASKVLIIMIDLRNYANYHNVVGTKFGKSVTLAGKVVASFKDLNDIAEKLCEDSIDFLNESVLHVKENEVAKRIIDGKVVSRAHLSENIEYRGWAFCHPQDEDDLFDSSIYFTYHATNAYVSFYNAYPDIFKEVFEKDINETDYHFDHQNLTNDEREIHLKNEEFIIRNKERINQFRLRTASSGRYFESLLKKKDTDIAFDFVRSDFTGISSSKVIETQENNAVINTIFIVAIFLNAGVDEDYEYLGKEKIDWFYNQLLFAISNVKKIYSILKVDCRQELVNSFNLYTAMLSDKYPARYNTLVQKFRSGVKNIAVYDLVPLLCNTYSIVFDYLIKYPQIEMVENLELIMENCSDETEWLWGDSNGFNINNHIYYIVALENFYRYYENYEEPLSGNTEVYKRVVIENENAYEKRLNDERIKVENLEEENLRLEQALREKKSNLDKEVEELARNTFENMFAEKVDSYLDEMLNTAAMFYLDTASSNETAAQIAIKIKSDKKLRTALALFNSIDFSKGDGVKLADYDKTSEIFKIKLNERITQIIADNIKD